MGIEFLNNLSAHEISADRLVNKSVPEKNTGFCESARARTCAPVKFYSRTLSLKRSYRESSYEKFVRPSFYFYSRRDGKRARSTSDNRNENLTLARSSRSRGKITRIIVMETRHFCATRARIARYHV